MGTPDLCDQCQSAIAQFIAVYTEPCADVVADDAGNTIALVVSELTISVDRACTTPPPPPLPPFPPPSPPPHPNGTPPPFGPWPDVLNPEPVRRKRPPPEHHPPFCCDGNISSHKNETNHSVPTMWPKPNDPESQRGYEPGPLPDGDDDNVPGGSEEDTLRGQPGGTDLGEGAP